MLTASLAGPICATDEEDELSVIQHSLLQLSFSSSPAVAAEGQTHNSETTDYVLLAHHNGGWEMSQQAARAMASAAGKPDSLLYDNYDLDLTRSFATSPAEIATPKASCWLHIIRNPFEMIASGYVYHAATSEPWLNTAFGRLAEDIAKESRPAFRHVLEGLTQVMDNAISGPLDWLPDPKADENYPQWLRRVDLDDGLLAEAIGPTNKSLSSLEFTDGFFHDRISILQGGYVLQQILRRLQCFVASGIERLANSRESVS